MRKILSLFLVAILAVAAAGCSNSSETASQSASAEASVVASADASTEVSAEVSESAEVPSESTEGAPASESAAENSAAESSDSASTEGSGSNVLVAYYSASGNTARVASYITDTVNADTFVITPNPPYSDADLDWTDSDSRVSQEHDNESLRNVALETTEVPNWESYDTVFLGYPIWWGIAAWPLDTFVSANSFEGKTVIPFCTSSSSGLGQSGELLAQLAGTGEWLEGERFSASASEDDVATWVESLGIGS